MKVRIYYHSDVAGSLLFKISVTSMYSFSWMAGAERCSCFSDLFTLCLTGVILNKTIYLSFYTGNIGYKYFI